MAQFDTEYQRLEASYSDSPPGEEDPLVHVPEGSKSPWHHIENLDLFFSRISFNYTFIIYTRRMASLACSSGRSLSSCSSSLWLPSPPFWSAVWTMTSYLPTRW
ncbi:autophagy related 9A [Phyllostomus discolor]|uniref:Autophagy related 9A n=1 Tax=Phyllostomus discolor TaxID=89673 RepID=A0A834AL82_9CHIR|nr:autophagy related 9A [Phyllostomus discolor]